jgi:hypothetical protein
MVLMQTIIMKRLYNKKCRTVKAIHAITNFTKSDKCSTAKSANNTSKNTQKTSVSNFCKASTPPIPIRSNPSIINFIKEAISTLAIYKHLRMKCSLNSRITICSFWLKFYVASIVTCLRSILPKCSGLWPSTSRRSLLRPRIF